MKILYGIVEYILYLRSNCTKVCVLQHICCLPPACISHVTVHN